MMPSVEMIYTLQNKICTDLVAFRCILYLIALFTFSNLRKLTNFRPMPNSTAESIVHVLRIHRFFKGKKLKEAAKEVKHAVDHALGKNT